VGVLGRAVDAAGATALIERLIKGGILRPPAAKDAKDTKGAKGKCGRSCPIEREPGPTRAGTGGRRCVSGYARHGRFPVFLGFPATAGIETRHLCNTPQMLKPPQISSPPGLKRGRWFVCRNYRTPLGHPQFHAVDCTPWVRQQNPGQFLRRGTDEAVIERNG
jgi:hypothetical protein